MMNLLLPSVWMYVLVLILLTVIFVLLVSYIRLKKNKDEDIKQVRIAAEEHVCMIVTYLTSKVVATERLMEHSSLPGKEFDIKGYYLLSAEMIDAETKELKDFKTATIKKEIDKKVHYFVPIHMLNPILMRKIKAVRKAAMKGSDADIESNNNPNATPSKEERMN